MCVFFYYYFRFKKPFIFICLISLFVRASSIDGSCMWHAFTFLSRERVTLKNRSRNDKLHFHMNWSCQLSLLSHLRWMKTHLSLQMSPQTLESRFTGILKSSTAVLFFFSFLKKQLGWKLFVNAVQTHKSDFSAAMWLDSIHVFGFGLLEYIFLRWFRYFNIVRVQIVTCYRDSEKI